MQKAGQDLARRAAATLAHALRRVGQRALPSYDIDIHRGELIDLRASSATAGSDPFAEACRAVERVFGWPMLDLAYLCPKGGVISASHPVNVVGDGSILDVNADRFGEGHEVRLLHPGDAEYGRFRPAFSGERHPGTHPAEFVGLQQDWDGVPDQVRELDGLRRRGPFWWLQEIGSATVARPPSLWFGGRRLDRPRAGLIPAH